MSHKLSHERLQKGDESERNNIIINRKQFT